MHVLLLHFVQCHEGRAVPQLTSQRLSIANAEVLAKQEAHEQVWHAEVKCFYAPA